MKIAILGAGKQARGALQFFIKQKQVVEITLTDKHEYVAKTVAHEFQATRASPIKYKAVDASSLEELSAFLEPFDLAFNALPYELALVVTEAAIAARTNLVDLGGNSEIVDQQLALSDKAQKAGVTIVPDCGLAPGLVSVLVGHAMGYSLIKEMHSIKIYVGGLPQDPENAGPLQYGEFFSYAGLLNEYTQPVRVLRNGVIQEIDPLTEKEEVSFVTDKVWYNLEAFSTSGGISTLPQSYQGQVKNLEYKTLRFPGHLRNLQLLKALDIFDEENLRKLLKPLPDQVFVKVIAKGISVDNRNAERIYKLHVLGKGIGHDISAMMKCTAFPAAITLMSINKTTAKGVFRQETLVNPASLVEEMKKQGLSINIEDRVYDRDSPYRSF